jgi:branched-subunit amino acid transport protein
MMWIAMLVGCLGVYLFKLAGLSVPDSVLTRPTIQRIAALLPIVLLAALIGVQTLGLGQSIHVDARLAGVTVAGVAVWRKAPFLLVVILAAATTALFRHFVPGS